MSPATVGEIPVKVSRSARYRRVMESLMIRDEPGHLVPMRFSDSQEILWHSIAPKLDARKKIWLIVLKGRQTFASTLFCSLGFVRTVESPNTQSLVIAQDLDTSTDLFNKVGMFYEYLPLPKIGKSKVKELILPLPGGTSRYRVISAGIAAKGRGTTQTCMHCSEVAYWPHPEILTGIFQAMPDLDDTLFIIESTANGMRGNGKMFYDEWQRAVSGESDLDPVFIPWWVMPKYRRPPAIPPDDWEEEERDLVKLWGVDGAQLAWRRYAINTKLQGSVEFFNQEYPSCPEDAFIFSGQPAFDRQAIIRQRPSVCEPLARGDLEGPERDEQNRPRKWTENPKGLVRLWKWPEPRKKYVIGADTAEGIEGGDYACAEVLEMETLEQVAVVHGLIPTWDFAQIVNDLGRYYQNAVLAVEVNNTGHAVQDHLIRTHQYPNLHRWRGKPDRMKPTVGRLFGWETNTYSRPLLIEAGRRAVNTGLVTLHEEKLLDELLHFSKTDFGKYEAEAGHDDRVLALLIALRSREENYFPARVSALHGLSEGELAGLPMGVRVVDHTEPAELGRHRFSRLLRDRAKQAVKTWMEM